MADDTRPIIIKRIKKIEGGHHGGAWKVAYADFVTAMMAFFLLLWLLNAVTEEQKLGIANYFRPTIALDSESATLTILEGQTQPIAEMAGGQAPELQGAEVGEGEAPAQASDAVAQTIDPADAGGAKPVDLQEALAAIAKEEENKFAEAKRQIEKAIEESAELRDLKQNLLIEQTDEGLRIQLLDREKISMFPSGSASMNEQSRRLLEKVAVTIKSLPNKLAISGHTDATPYSGGGQYSNWELSTDRANASRRVLVEAGINPSRVETVNGKAETDPLVKENPFAPQNRRISIVLLREEPRPSPPAEARQPAAQTAPAGSPATPASPPGLPPELVAPSP